MSSIGPALPSDPMASSAALVAAQLRAARCLLADPVTAPETAIVHLRAACELLAAPSEATQGADNPGSLEEMARVLREIEAGVRARPSRTELLSWLSHLEHGGSAHRRPVPMGWIAMGVLIGTAIAAFAAFAAFVRVPPAEGRWHGAYHAGPDFAGPPQMRFDHDVAFDWQHAAAIEGLPRDGFSVRWDTCLEVDRTDTFAFQLVSDDGSRLLIDGRPVVDNWGPHGKRARGAEIELEAGVHHLTVEYFEERSSASVSLVASLDGGPPRPIPPSLLRRPDLTGDRPCP